MSCNIKDEIIELIIDGIVSTRFNQLIEEFKEYLYYYEDGDERKAILTEFVGNMEQARYDLEDLVKNKYIEYLDLLEKRLGENME